MNTEKMFEVASRKKFRFVRTTKGNINVEDLWDLPLLNKNGLSLDDVAKKLSKILIENNEKSFVLKANPENSINELKLEIVKHIILVKLDEAEKEKNNLFRKTQKEKILRIIADKEDESLKGESLVDLKKMVEDFK